MTTYKNIIGKAVRNLSSNLDNDQAEGQIWYNTTDNALKAQLGRARPSIKITSYVLLSVAGKFI